MSTQISCRSRGGGVEFCRRFASNPRANRVAAMAGAAAVALGLAVAPIAQAAPDPTLNTALIDPAVPGILVVEKHDTPASASANYGPPVTAAEHADFASPIESVQFKITQVNITEVAPDSTTTQLTPVDANWWRAAAYLADGFSSTLASVAPQSGIVTPPDASAFNFTSAVGVSDSRVTDSDGLAIFSGLDLGLYFVEEFHTPDGVVKAQPFVVIVPTGNGHGSTDPSTGWFTYSSSNSDIPAEVVTAIGNGHEGDYIVFAYPKNTQNKIEKSVDTSTANKLGQAVTYTLTSTINSTVRQQCVADAVAALLPATPSDADLFSIRATCANATAYQVIDPLPAEYLVPGVVSDFDITEPPSTYTGDTSWSASDPGTSDIAVNLVCPADNYASLTYPASGFTLKQDSDGNPVLDIHGYQLYTVPLTPGVDYSAGWNGSRIANTPASTYPNGDGAILSVNLLSNSDGTVTGTLGTALAHTGEWGLNNCQIEVTFQATPVQMGKIDNKSYLFPDDPSQVDIPAASDPTDVDPVCLIDASGQEDCGNPPLCPEGYPTADGTCTPPPCSDDPSQGVCTPVCTETVTTSCFPPNTCTPIPDPQNGVPTTPPADGTEWCPVNVFGVGALQIRKTATDLPNLGVTASPDAEPLEFAEFSVFAKQSTADCQESDVATDTGIFVGLAKDGLFSYTQGDDTVTGNAEDGNYILGGLLYHGFCVVETKAPAGYLPTQTIFTVDVDDQNPASFLLTTNPVLGKGHADNEICIPGTPNELCSIDLLVEDVPVNAGFQLPFTGGLATAIYILLGVVVVGGGFWYLRHSRKALAAR